MFSHRAMRKPTILNTFFHNLLAILALLCLLPALVGAQPVDPPRSAAKPEPQIFAVSGFPVISARADYSWLGVGLGDDLATRLARCDRHLFQVERLQFNDVLRAQQMEMLTQGVSAALEPDATEHAQLQQLAQATRASFPGQKWGARYVIVGSLWLEGAYPQDQARLKANVRLVEVATGQILSSVQASSDGSEDGYVHLQEQLAEQLAERLGVPVEERVRVRDHRREGGEVYRRFAQAREALYQGRYQEAKTLSEQAEAAGAYQLLPQILETNRQAHERLVKQLADEAEVDRLNEERTRQLEIGEQAAKETAALFSFEVGEQYRINAESEQRKPISDEVKVKDWYQRALIKYDEYLRHTQTNPIVWEFESGIQVQGHGAITEPVFADGVVYTGSVFGRLRAFDAQSGNVVWEFIADRNDDEILSDFYNQIYSPRIINGIAYAKYGSHIDKTLLFNISRNKIRESRLLCSIDNTSYKEPTDNPYNFKIDDGFAIVFTKQRLHVYEMSTCRLLWRSEDTAEDHGDFLVKDQVLYAVIDNSLYAYEVHTGRLLWKKLAEKNGIGYSKLTVANGVVYAPKYKNLYAYEIRTGKLIWKSVKEANGHFDFFSKPTVMDKIVYIMDESDDNNLNISYLYAFNVHAGKFLWQVEAGKEISTFDIIKGVIYTGLEFRNYNNINEYLRAFNAYNGKEFLKIAREKITVIEFTDNVVTIFSEDGYLYAFDVGSGKELWKVHIGKKTVNINVIQDVVYIGSDDGYLRGFEANSGKQLFSFKLTGSATDFIVIKDTIYVSTGSRLIAIHHGLKNRVNSNINYVISNKSKVLSKLGYKKEALRILSRLFKDNPLQKPETSNQWVNLNRISGSNELANFIKLTYGSEQNSQQVRAREENIDDQIDTRTSPLLWSYHSKTSVEYSLIVNGIAYVAGDKYLRAFDAHVGKLLWEHKGNYQTTATGGRGTPIVANGVLYIATMDGYLRALEAHTGKLQWKWNCKGKFKNLFVTNELVHVVVDAQLHTLNAHSGKLLWKYTKQNLEEDINPLISDGVLYIITASNLENKNVKAFETHTGRLIWRYNTSQELLQPIIYDKYLFTQGSDYLMAFDKKTGKLLWKNADGSDISFWKIPVIVDKIIYIIKEYTTLKAFNIHNGKLLWEFTVDEQLHTPTIKNAMLLLRSTYPGSAFSGSGHYPSWDYSRLRVFEAHTGKFLWTFEMDGDLEPPVIVDDIAYFGSNDGYLRGFNIKTGKLVWIFSAGSNVQTQTPLINNEVAYISSGDGYFIKDNFILRAFDTSQINNGHYTPKITWGSEEQFFSYLLWDKAGLAARQIFEGYDLRSVLSQSHLTPNQLAEGLDQLAQGKPYHGPGALAEDPKDLCPSWYQFICARPDHAELRPAVAFYLDRASKGAKDRAAYLAEAKRLAPNVDLSPWGLK